MGAEARLNMEVTKFVKAFALVLSTPNKYLKKNTSYREDSRKEKWKPLSSKWIIKIERRVTRKCYVQM